MEEIYREMYCASSFVLRLAPKFLVFIPCRDNKNISPWPLHPKPLEIIVSGNVLSGCHRMYERVLWCYSKALRRKNPVFGTRSGINIAQLDVEFADRVKQKLL